MPMSLPGAKFNSFTVVVEEDVWLSKYSSVSIATVSKNGPVTFYKEAEFMVVRAHDAKRFDRLSTVDLPQG